jgi:hypothetical protein
MAPDVQQLAYRNIWLGLGYLLLVITLTISLLPVAQQVQPLMVGDKVLHALCFMLLMVWFSGIVQPSKYLQLGLRLLAFGAAIELLQYSTGYRSMEFADLAADAVGVITGGVLAKLGLGRWCATLERRINGSA